MLLTKGNGDLKADGIYSWTLPALGARLSNGKTMRTCPNAGACASLCYARTGNFMFKDVKAAHLRNLEYSLNTAKFIDTMLSELHHKRFDPTGVPASYFRLLTLETLNVWEKEWALSGGRAVRIHDSGDFYNEKYMNAWMHIVELTPHVFFYAYTKEVSMIKSARWPSNIVFIFSLGGKQDYLIDKSVDRHSEVFPNIASLLHSGYTHNLESDILAALMPNNRVGLLRNNISSLKHKQGLKTFSELQLEQGG